MIATCSILQSVIKYAKPAVSIYPVVKNNWQPTPATNRFFGPTISKARRYKWLHLCAASRDLVKASQKLLFNTWLNIVTKSNDIGNRIQLPMT